MFSWAEKYFLGVDPAEEQRRSDKANADRAALDRQRFDRGLIDSAELNRRLENNTPTDVQGEIDAAFEEGLAEGVDNVKGAIAAPINLGWRLIPWQLLAVGAVALFVYMGGFAWLKGRLK